MVTPNIFQVVLLCVGILTLQGIDAAVGRNKTQKTGFIEKASKRTNIKEEEIMTRSLKDFLKSLIMFKFDFSYLGMKFNIDLLESKPAVHVHPPPIYLGQTYSPGQPLYSDQPAFGPDVQCCDQWRVVNTRGLQGGKDTQIYVKKMVDANSRQVVIMAIQFEQNQEKHWAYYTQRDGMKPVPFKVV